MRYHVFVDFDGTISSVDTTDLLLDRFAGSEWHDIEDEWARGEIGSRECLVRQIDLIRATPAALDAAIDEIAIDPEFPEFVRVCKANGVAMTIVSDGLDRSVNRVLRRAGVTLPAFANRLEWLGGERWKLTFPHARDDCSALSGNCKCEFLKSSARPMRIMIGDGRSDFCAAGRADLTFAKDTLLERCRNDGLHHIPFKGFAEVTEHFATWLRHQTPPQEALQARAGDK